MTAMPTFPFLVALSPPGQSGQSPWVSLLPFVLMIGIFYVLVLLPMRRRQKKITDFQGSLKVGDRIITTSGIYGQIMKLDEKSVKLEIAEKVRIEIARSAVGGYQGQEPLVQQDGGGL